MRRRIAGLLLVLGLAATATADIGYVDDEQITVAATAIGLTSSKITPTGKPAANSGSCRLELAEIRYRMNGQAPTTTVGTLLEVGDTVPISGHDALVLFSAIRTGATSGQLDCTYYAQ